MPSFFCTIQLVGYLRQKYNTELDVQLDQYLIKIHLRISVDFLEDIYKSFSTDMLQHDGIWSLYDNRVLLEVVILTEVYSIEYLEFELLQHTQPGWMFVPCELTRKNEKHVKFGTMMIGKSNGGIQKCIWHFSSFQIKRIVLSSLLVVLEKAADVPCKYWTFDIHTTWLQSEWFQRAKFWTIQQPHLKSTSFTLAWRQLPLCSRRSSSQTKYL